MGFKFNPLTGSLDLVGSGSGSATDHHSGYYYVAPATTLTVAEYKQSICYGVMTVDGSLVVDGQLILEL